MVDAADRKMDDAGEYLLGAVVRMLAPADIAQRAGGQAQPQPPGIVALEQRRDPIVQQLTGIAEAAVELGQFLAGGDQGIARLLLGRELVEDMSLAQAVSGEKDS